MIMWDSRFMWSSYGIIFALLTSGVNQNLLVLFFELMVAKCFYLSGNLFPGFGYGKPKGVFTIIWPYTWYMNYPVKVSDTHSFNTRYQIPDIYASKLQGYYYILWEFVSQQGDLSLKMLSTLSISRSLKVHYFLYYG